MENVYPKPEFSAPLYIAWEVTWECNAKCLHCYSASGPGGRSSDELDTASAVDLIDKLADAGLLILAFSGGEPLVRKDIYELMAHASARGLVVNVASNGALVNEKNAIRLKEAGVRSVTISLDAVDPGLHNHFRQHAHLFPLAIKAIRMLKKHGIRVVISFTPTRLNYQEGRKVVELALKEGADAVNMSEYVPAGRGTTDMALTGDLLKSVVQEWIDMRNEFAGRIQIIWHDCRVALLVPEADRDKYAGCGAGKLTARIMPNGALTPCVFLPNVVGNLSKQSFDEVWIQSPLLDAIRDRKLEGGNCSVCVHKKVCGGCRAMSMAHSGSPLKGDAGCWLFPEPPTESIPSSLVFTA